MQIELQFLDLTGIDEYEKNAVLTSLQPLQSDVRFPWYIGGKPANEGTSHIHFGGENCAIKTITVDQFLGSNWTKLGAEFAPQPPNSNAAAPISTIIPENEFAVEPFTDPTLTNIPYNSSQYYLPQIPPIQPTYGFNHFSPTGNPPDLPVTNAVYSPYPNYPPKVFYEVPSTQPTFINHAADAGIFYPHAAGHIYLDNSVQPEIAPSSQWESQALIKAAPLLSADTPAFTPKNQLPAQEKAADEPKTSAEPPAEAPIEDTSSTLKQGSGAKSWASLFTPKGGSGGAMVNGAASASCPGNLLKAAECCPIKNPRKNHFIDPDCYRMGGLLR